MYFLLVNLPLLACERRSCCSRLSDWLNTGSIQFDKSGRKRQWRRYANGKTLEQNASIPDVWLFLAGSQVLRPPFIGKGHCHGPIEGDCGGELAQTWDSETNEIVLRIRVLLPPFRPELHRCGQFVERSSHDMLPRYQRQATIKYIV